MNILKSLSNLTGKREDAKLVVARKIAAGESVKIEDLDELLTTTKTSAEEFDRRLDILRFGGWMVRRRDTLAAKRKPRSKSTVPPVPAGDAGYDAHRERARARSMRLSRSGRDIGELPPVVDPDRRDSCERDLRRFLETYLPLTFSLEWSDDHLRVIGLIEQATLEGGLFAMAMPRGSGKTSLCEGAALWAMLYGHRQFVCLIGSELDSATESLQSIRTEIETNDVLIQDFPAACFPVAALEGIHQRAPGQLYQGKQTHIRWTANEIVLPTIDGAASSGAIVRVAGITGRVRGMKFKRPDGKPVRPSLVLVDDPQTDESAKSLSQCDARERIIAGAILGLAGPGQKISGLAAVTVVHPGDLSDRLLDRERHPQWQGERCRMVYSFPSDEKLWTQYAEKRAEGLRTGKGLTIATNFYRRHRKKMDVGAVVAWTARFNHDELSAIQHAMNLKLQDERAFFAEYQNDPKPIDDGVHADLKPAELLARINRRPRGEVPAAATAVTMFVDVQGRLLYWMIVAWEPGMTGYVVDYGAWPEQNLDVFTLRDARRTLQQMTPKAGLEGAIYAGLQTLTTAKLGRELRREGGGAVRIDRCLVDANWGVSTDVVYQFCRESPFAAQLTPSHGRWVGAMSRSMNEYKRVKGDRVGLNWRMPAPRGRRAIRHVAFDVNWWKSHVWQRLSTAIGDSGCLTFYGADGDRHRMLVDHLLAEIRTPVAARGRTVDEWKLRAPHLDNHLLDCIVGCAVAASMQGVGLSGIGGDRAPRGRRQRVRLSELQRRRSA